MATMTPDERLQMIGDYKHGSIKRIKLRNFLTYFDVEVTPGPRLNMVIGPNGTGKSTILCAICLGLGGEPRLLGRASEVETFIANGEDDGEIEIELVNTLGGPNPVIRREIRRNQKPKSLFYWNDSQSSGKAVREKCLAEYNITVDNLCTFLPQDRVGSFSGFDSKQLLIETEKSLSADQKLYTTHQKLIQEQEKMRGGGNQKGNLEDKLQQLQQEAKRLERAKDLMQERETAEAQALLLRKKLLWLEFDALVEATNLKKAAKADLKKQYAELKASIQPLENEYNAARERLDTFTDDSSRFDGEIRAHQKEMDKQIKKYEKHEDQIETLIQDLLALDATRAAKEKKAEELRLKVQQYLDQMEQFPSMDTLKEEEIQCRNDVKAASTPYENAKRESERLNEEYREVEDEYKRVQTKMHKLQDEKSRRNDRIFRQLPNLKTISDWMLANRTRFRKPVVGPVMCEITTKNHQTASYLEQHVPNAALKSFVVQCKEDYDLLYRSIREELGIPINITMIREVEPVKRMYSDEKMTILKRDHGVLGYMDETFDAPPFVMAALRSAAAIEKVLIGTEATQTSLDNKGLLEFLAQPEGGSSNQNLQGSCIFSSQGNKSFKYTSIISKYSGKASHRIDTVKDAKWLAPGVSDEAKANVKAELDAVVKNRERIQPAIQQAEQELAEAQEQAQLLRAKVKDAQENLRNLRKMENKYNSSKAKLLETERDLEVSNDNEKEKLTGELNNRVHHSLQALEAHSDSYLKLMKATVKYSGIRLNKAAVESEEKRLSVILQDALEEIRTTEIEYKSAQADFKESMKRTVAAKKNADEMAPLEDPPNSGNDLPLKAELEALGVETLDEALLALEDAESKVQNIHADHNAIREYERNQAEMEEVQSQLDDLIGMKKKQRLELDEAVAPWKEALTLAVQKVDTLFGKYMAEMGCTGEVQLTMGGEPTEEMPYGNFREWGIEIRVSFREGHKLQVLSARVQSGGERSVSTIMYLMALQGMMVAPFRCVDEINQGLDERNERLVFKRIVSNSTRAPGEEGPTDHEGQYFLITPKLLPNLYDMEVEAMTVLFIFNGPHNVKNPQDFDMAKLLALRKRAITETEAAQDDENTPNSQPSRTPRAAKVPRRSLSSRNSDTVAVVDDV